MNRITKLALIMTASSLSAASAALADETVKYRSVVHVVSQQVQEIGDVEGHIALMFRASGIASFPDGSVGTTYYTASVDLTKGAGSFPFAWNNLTFNDGSAIWFRTSGTVAADGPNALVKGAGTITSGTGRYAGAKGDVTFSGARIGPAGVGANFYFDYVINVKS
jgi:hypothetical protein